MHEIYKDIKEWEHLYEVSNTGNVKSKERTVVKKNGNLQLVKERVLKRICKNGYFFIALCKDGICTHYPIHRLVAEAFVENPLEKPCVNHIDGDKNNCCADNLEWVTHKENITHAIESGLFNPVESRSQYSDDEVSKVFNLHKKGLTQKQISKETGISRSHVCNILNGRTRK